VMSTGRFLVTEKCCSLFDKNHVLGTRRDRSSIGPFVISDPASAYRLPRAADGRYPQERYMKAQDIMSANPTCVTPDTSIEEAARMMKDQNIGMLPVVEDEGSKRVIGVVTDRDITIRHVAEGHSSHDCPVREAMSNHVTTASADSSIASVMELMGKEQVRRIPVVDERGELVGVIAQADLATRTEADRRVGATVEQISQPYGKHAQ
jgi:CBS domain-containing protein